MRSAGPLECAAVSGGELAAIGCEGHGRSSRALYLISSTALARTGMHPSACTRTRACGFGMDSARADCNVSSRRDEYVAELMQ